MYTFVCTDFTIYETGIFFDWDGDIMQIKKLFFVVGGNEKADSAAKSALEAHMGLVLKMFSINLNKLEHQIQYCCSIIRYIMNDKKIISGIREKCIQNKMTVFRIAVIYYVINKRLKKTYHNNYKSVDD